MLKFSREGFVIKTYITTRKVLMKGTHTPNMKVLCRIVRKFCGELKLSKCRSNVTVKVTCSKFIVPSKGLVIENTRTQYESPMSYGKKLCAELKLCQN